MLLPESTAVCVRWILSCYRANTAQDILFVSLVDGNQPLSTVVTTVVSIINHHGKYPSAIDSCVGVARKINLERCAVMESKSASSMEGHHPRNFSSSSVMQRLLFERGLFDSGRDDVNRWWPAIVSCTAAAGCISVLYRF